MPWLMKAEPDSRVVKGKDVKVIVIAHVSIIAADETTSFQWTTLRRLGYLRGMVSRLSQGHDAKGPRCAESRGEEYHEGEDEARGQGQPAYALWHRIGHSDLTCRSFSTTRTVKIQVSLFRTQWKNTAELEKVSSLWPKSTRRDILIVRNRSKT